jgi:hypothetical protein
MAQSGTSLASGEASGLVTTILGEHARLWTSGTSLRLVVRDVDAPDQPLSAATIDLTKASAIGNVRALAVRTSEVGQGIVDSLASGEYSVRATRIGYRKFAFTLRLRSRCQQVLEVYLRREVDQLHRCQVMASTTPPCAPDGPPTPSRAVLTTCPPDA